MGGFDLDAFLLHGVHGVLGEFLVEHGEDFGSDVVEADSRDAFEGWVEGNKVLYDEVA